MEIKVIGQMDGYEKDNRVYAGYGLSPCITARDYKDPPKVLIREENDGSKSNRTDGQHDRPHI